MRGHSSESERRLVVRPMWPVSNSITSFSLAPTSGISARDAGGAQMWSRSAMTLSSGAVSFFSSSGFLSLSSVFSPGSSLRF